MTRSSASHSRTSRRPAHNRSTSKTLAPTLRLGWLLAPARLVRALADEVLFSVIAPPRLQQLAFGDFLLRGELDRHLRRDASPVPAAPGRARAVAQARAADGGGRRDRR